MKIILDKNVFLEKLTLSSHFTSQRSTTSQILQGVLIRSTEEDIHLYSSNLNNYFHTTIKIKTEKELNILVEPQKIIEFLSLLQSGKIELTISEKKITINQGKTTGSFPLLTLSDFPLPPKITGKEQKIITKNFVEDLSQIIYSAAKDEGRPALTGVNFITNEEQTMVTTDGFRLSLIKNKKIFDHPAFIVPASFLEEIIRMVGDEKEISFYYIEEEKIVVFKFNQMEIYSRLIDGEFPPFGKVIPEKSETRTIIDKDELLRAIKLISIFAKEQSNIIILDFKKEEIVIRPKTETKEDNTIIEAKTEGEEQTVAFNYKFLIDFLNHVTNNKKNIILEVLRSDAPVVFKVEGKENQLHIIMPVRIQE